MYINNIIEIRKVNIIFFLIQKFCHPLKEQFSNDILARVCNYTGSTKTRNPESGNGNGNGIRNL